MVDLPLRQDEPDLIIGARKGSPLILGVVAPEPTRDCGGLRGQDWVYFVLKPAHF